MCREKSYKENHLQEVKEWKRKWRLKNLDKTRKWVDDSHSKKRFGGLKRAVLERDNFSCTICGRQYPEFRIAIHHIDENKQNNTMENLISLCCKCHHDKHWKRN